MSLLATTALNAKIKMLYCLMDIVFAKKAIILTMINAYPANIHVKAALCNPTATIATLSASEPLIRHRLNANA